MRFWESWGAIDGSPRVADLCSCAGGASRGIQRAWPRARIVGVDLMAQPRYPYSFVKMDALDFPLDNIDFVWASPPCQAFSPTTEQWQQAGREFVDILEPMRYKLVEWGGPFIIENVPQAPLVAPVMLCGTMFPPLRVFRHRHFETNVSLLVPAHRPHDDKTRWFDGDFVTLAGHPGNRYPGDLRSAIGIDWMTIKEMCQAVPPAFAEYLVRQVVVQ